ncbi:MAG TPA: phosphoribosyltransferase family protein, partial [Rhizomicrobium sp.]
VFAADLVRALAREGVNLDIEMLWLRSYGDKRVASAISMIAGPSEQIGGRHVLVIDGVLDGGRTIKKAVSLIEAAGAASVRVAVALDKKRPDAVAKADHVGFEIGNDFVIGYGMDDAGRYRTLPYIGRAV